eukprot:TRINITY_DN674_c0_g3_i2.p1 TRINITY_DN674_c0_g3~~TRINITY_DN674_c0_g3_i2.p1  ORF type:complete len:501 (-),score=93.67 TRINITY_DN674_c0_g3_i2:832-2334(-)
MSLIRELTDYINAAFTGLWIQTHEPDEAERELVELARTSGCTLAVWDLARGFRLPLVAEATVPEVHDPVGVLRVLPTLALPEPTEVGTSPATTLLVLPNFHRFLQSYEVVQTLFQTVTAGKQRRIFVVILSPATQVPVELEKQFVIIEHSLPTREQLATIAHETLGDEPDNIPTGKKWETLLDAASGLTRYEAEGAFALSLARHDALRPEAIWELKAQSLRKQNLLTLHRGGEDFSSLGGLNTLKSFCQRALQPGRSVKARGALLLSPPGCGKSAFCRALGNEVGRPVLTLDIGSLLGGLVGDTERNIRQALRIADAMSPSILFVDELEKGLSGLGGTGDSGVSTRLFGTLLSWLADHESDVFFIGTANDISRLPPEFTRAERLDAVFFLDLPGAAERQTIWSLYRRQYDIPASQPIPTDTDWTGAEIKSCCRLSALLDLPLSEAARNVVPVARTAAEAIESLRQWASGRCLSADHPGLYTKPAAGSSPRRRVSHGTSAN